MPLTWNRAAWARSARIGLLLGVGALAGAAAGWHWRAPRPAAPIDPKVVARIGRDLRAAPAGAVLLAGNSHAGIAAERAPPCTPWVNAGIGGATAASYARTLDRVQATTRVRLAALLIGTNDILRRDNPLAAATLARFRADAEHILGWLEPRAAQVIVAAVPPIGTPAVRKREPAAVAAYSAVLADLCRERGCRFLDPFAAMRDGDGGLGSVEALPDAVHLADYPAMLQALDLCPTMQGASAP